MFRRTDLADIYSLADPDRCKRYVIVATDALESLFIKMRVYPNKSKDGTLYLQSLDGILKSMPPDIRAKQREYCVELAFFFIRIFQIFGALFLSMYDSRLPDTDPSDDIGRESSAKGVAFLNPKDFLGFSNPPQQSSWFGAGGELSRRDGGGFYINDETNPNFILNYSLVAPRIENRGPMKFEGSLGLTLDQTSLYRIPNDNTFQRTILVPDGGGYAQPTVYYDFDRGTNSYKIQGTLIIEANGPRYRVSLTNFSPVGDWGTNSSKLNGIRIDPEFLQQVPADTPPKSVGNAYPNTRNQTLPVVLKAMFDKVIIAGLGVPPFSVAKYLKKLRYISGSNDTNQNISGTHVYLIRGQENESSVKIAYSDKIKVQGEDKPKDITITARMTIERLEKESNISVKISFRVKLDFGSSDIRPPEYRSLISLPTGQKIMIFRGNTEDSAPSSDVNDLSIPEYLERIFKEITSSTYTDNIKGLKITRAGLVEPYDSNQINDSLKVKKLWQAMAKDPPIKSHCVARAVQLLSLEAIKGNMKAPAYSSICRLSFGYQKDGSLPTPGKPVIEESGIYALSLLFFEGVKDSSPYIMDPAAYKEYLRYLKYLFERYPSIDMIKDVPSVAGKVQDPDAIPAKLSDIREKALNLCKDRGDARIAVPRDLAGNLRSVTSNLFSQQKAHFQKALALIFSIFDQNSIERDKKLKFNARIVSGGMPEINRIANETRNLLLQYYKGCELTYRDGLLMIYNYEKTTGKPLDSLTVDQIRSGATTQTVSGTSTVQSSNSNSILNNLR
jgi:hypothetical protein